MYTPFSKLSLLSHTRLSFPARSAVCPYPYQSQLASRRRTRRWNDRAKPTGAILKDGLPRNWPVARMLWETTCVTSSSVVKINTHIIPLLHTIWMDGEFDGHQMMPSKLLGVQTYLLPYWLCHMLKMKKDCLTRTSWNFIFDCSTITIDPDMM